MRFFLACVFLCLLMLSSGAYARDADVALAPLNVSLRYNIYWNGLPLGRVRVQVDETSSTYHAVVDTKTRGLAEMFSPVRGYVVTSGIKDIMGEYIPTDYRSENKDDDKTAVTEISYSSEGDIAASKRTPPDDPAHRPPVAMEDLYGAHDPVSAFLMLRRNMMANLKAKQPETSVRTFDGRRLAEFTFRAINPGTKMIHGKIVPMINMILTRKPISGYTEKELKKYDKGDPTVHVYFAQNGIFLPLSIEAQVMFGMIRCEIDEETMPQLLTQTP